MSCGLLQDQVNVHYDQRDDELNISPYPFGMLEIYELLDAVTFGVVWDGTLM